MLVSVKQVIMLLSIPYIMLVVIKWIIVLVLYKINNDVSKCKASTVGSN